MPHPSQHTALVALCSPPFASLTYSLPAWLPPEAFVVGQRVAIPLGKGLRVGVILALTEATQQETGKASFTLKPLLWPLESRSMLSEGYLEFATQLAKRQTASAGQILGNILPAGLRTTQVRIRFFGEGKPQELKLQALAAYSEAEREYFAQLWMHGKAEVVRTGQNPLDRELCVLASDPPWAVRPAAKAQMAVLEYLFEHGAVTRRALGNALGKTTTTTLAKLAERGLVHIRPMDDAEDEARLPAIAPPMQQGDTAFVLTEHQQTVYQPLLQSIHCGQAETRLLFGVTGSGKTAIYLELAREVLAQGRSVLLLAPEVALAFKLWGDAAAALPNAQRTLFHGYQTPSAKESTFSRLAASAKMPQMVIGTRSALLLPLENIGLIVLDEEHDASFKQDEGFTYQAKEVAWYRAGKQNALLLLGSATPDIKSYHAAVEHKIPLHVLTERASGGSLPEVSLVHMPKGRADACLLAPESMQALNAVVSRGEQAVILLNRRGYAPLMYCLSCAAVVKCPHCDIGLAYHKGRERLLCHYCGYSIPFPSPCSSCKGLQFLPMGEGTEKLEEHLASSLPAGTGILRLDRDSTRRPGRMEEILTAFARKEASILVGTQMLSKGHHFPDVTLAIVADADLGLNLPDYRAAERTFQLLLQSAGRSGRGEKPGTVLIQTRDPSHYCWEFVRQADYEGFFVRELELRQRRMYPPFIRLGLIRISYPMDVSQGAEEVTALGTVLRAKGRELGVTVLGPAPAPLPFLKGRRRFHCLIKSQEWQPVRTLYTAAVEATRKGNLRVRLDLDPVNML